MPRPMQHDESSEDESPQGALDFSKFMNPNCAREFIAQLPPKIRERVTALQGLDAEYKKLKMEMSSKIDHIDREYLKDIAPLCAARAKIVNGDVEPTDDDVKEGFPEEHKGEVSLEGEPGKTVGLPRFWLEALQHHVIIAEFITDRDEEALALVKDVQCVSKAADEAGENGEGFDIIFEFGENPFFEESTLKKSFHLTREKDNEVVLSKAIGTKITWKSGKNLTIRSVTKKVKAKGKKGVTKYVTKEEPCESFFRFFMEADEAGEDEDGGDEEEWMAMAETLRDKIIPFATDYFTGDAPDGSSDLDEDEWDDEDEEEEEEEEEMPMPMRGGRGGRGGGRGGAPGGRGGYSAGAGGAQGQDCKQQ